jgi:RNA polymerase sigma factor (sigma-70 family)
VNEVELIKACIKKKPKAQELLYQKYAPKMLSVCFRYAENIMEAEDILQEAFIKMFSKINQFRFEGSFEGWFRRLVVNTAINHYRSKNPQYNFTGLTEANEMHHDDFSVQQLSANEIMDMIKDLPQGYRTVFNLYVLDGYSHKEIADLLNITESTSKSQLARARKQLKLIILKREPEYEQLLRRSVG